ncbi:MAG: hypothetical protein HOQ27_11355 [Dermatophilaceae bacterium]|nr:hypothetical protein [Dermatophilaceae bacterium]
MDETGFEDVGSGGGLTCMECGAYVWKFEGALQRHRDWHGFIEEDIEKAGRRDD